MDNIFLETFYFFVPYRQVWDHWEEFNGEQKNPGDSTDYTIPILADDSPVTRMQMQDYMGIPLGVIADDVEISALPFRAINHIYNNWFRDQNLIQARIVQTDDGPDDVDVNGYHTPFRRRKRFDYLTSCLPWPQKRSCRHGRPRRRRPNPRARYRRYGYVRRNRRLRRRRPGNAPGHR